MFLLLTLFIWGRLCLSGFGFPVKSYSLYYLPILYSMEVWPHAYPTFKKWYIWAPSSAHVIIYTNYLEFCTWKLSIYVIIYISMDSYISILYFALWSNITLFCCWNSSNFSHWKFFHLILVYSWQIPIICMFYFYFNTSLLYGITI